MRVTAADLAKKTLSSQPAEAKAASSEVVADAAAAAKAAVDPVHEPESMPETHAEDLKAYSSYVSTDIMKEFVAESESIPAASVVPPPPPPPPSTASVAKRPPSPSAAKPAQSQTPEVPQQQYASRLAAKAPAPVPAQQRAAAAKEAKVLAIVCISMGVILIGVNFIPALAMLHGLLGITGGIMLGFGLSGLLQGQGRR